MPFFIVFLFLALIFASINGKLKHKSTNNSSHIFLIMQVICVIISSMGMIVAMGPSRSSGGTEMTVALNKMTGGWAGTIILGFMYCCALNGISFGMSALVKNITKGNEQFDTINAVTSKKRLFVPRIILLIILIGCRKMIFCLTY